MYTSEATRGWLPASLMTAPPYECPTRTVAVLAVEDQPGRLDVSVE
jgi:hypothetical protein